MAYTSLQDCLNDLEKHNHLVRITEEVDPNLEMAAIQLRVYEQGGPALLFEQVKGTKYKAASNIFGSIERSRFIFRNSFSKVQQLIALKNNPIQAFKKPIQHLHLGLASLNALPKKNPSSKPVMDSLIQIEDLPLIKHWPNDGGAFITLPQVYSEDISKPGIMNANLGMYRIQLNGNEYILNEEVGLHYQIHRGIGIHQHKANQKGQPLKVSIFVGGPPAHTLAAVMPLPEGMSELTFAGLLGGRRFRYCYHDGYMISADADFVICGEVYADETKPEGPFGDHLGYYSLTHDFPVLKVRHVFAREQAIWPFTVVGRPPQEDTSFGALIHELTGDAIPAEIPGLKEVNAVDAAGVHPLLLAIGSERYTPFNAAKKPAELLTIANRVLGTGQLSLAKYLFIAAEEENTTTLSTKDIAAYFQFVLQRVDWKRDIHFQTQTTIDTLDYSGTSLNSGSKVVIAAYGAPHRTLTNEVPTLLQELAEFMNPQIILPGIIALQTKPFENYEEAENTFRLLDEQLASKLEKLSAVAMIVVCDDSYFTSNKLNNFLWVTFTRSNPSHDIYGIKSNTIFKHWGCEGPLVIDARIKTHHAPPLELDTKTTEKVDKLFAKGGSLHGLAE